jgi:hypothetical protein
MEDRDSVRHRGGRVQGIRGGAVASLGGGLIGDDEVRVRVSGCQGGAASARLVPHLDYVRVVGGAGGGMLSETDGEEAGDGEKNLN